VVAVVAEDSAPLLHVRKDNEEGVEQQPLVCWARIDAD
jgi:hypothetical protein